VPTPTHPKPGKPVGIAGFFDPGSLETIATAIERSGVAARAPLYVGHYAPNPDQADALRAAGARYAPMFSIQPGNRIVKGKYVPSAYFQERGRGGVLTTSDLALLNARDPKYSGAIPLAVSKKPLPRVDHAGWGLELGRRYRDWIRAARDGGIVIDTWQFDEILLEAETVSLEQQQLHRTFMAGILQGLFEGRKELNDEDEQGIVWYALQHPPPRHTPLPLVSTKTPGLAQFWEILDASAWRIVGEEYTPFDGRPETAAGGWVFFQRLLLREKPLGGPVRRALGAKYVPGMSPGYHKDVGRLGGRVHKDWTRNRVNRWRNAYILRRALVAHPSGFAQFNFTGDNAPLEPPTLDAFKAIDYGLSAMAK
jgi:hypothetical protein